MLEFKIALRYITSSNKEKFISIAALLAFLGITLGVAILIIVLSVMNGYREEIQNKLLNVKSHIVLSTSRDKVESILSKVNGFEEVKYIAPRISGFGMLVHGSKSTGIAYSGMFEKNVREKLSLSKRKHTEENWIFLGKTLASTLRVKAGDKVKMIVPEIRNTVLGAIPKSKTMTVIDIFDAGIYEYNSGMAFIPVEIASNFNKNEDISEIEINLHELDKVAKFEWKLIKLMPGIRIVNWMENNSSIVSAVEIEKTVMTIILSFIIFIAAFNIISSLTMLVHEKAKDIAILRTIGMRKISVLGIFFLSGMSIGCIGTLIGIIVGMIISYNIVVIQQFLESILGVNLFDPVIYFLTTLPSKVICSDVLFVGLISIILSCLATIYPAYKATSISPTDILRNI